MIYVCFVFINGCKIFIIIMLILCVKEIVSVFFRFASILFLCNFNAIIFYYGWGAWGCLWVWVKIFSICGYAFL